MPLPPQQVLDLPSASWAGAASQQGTIEQSQHTDICNCGLQAPCAGHAASLARIGRQAGRSPIAHWHRAVRPCPCIPAATPAAMAALLGHGLLLQVQRQQRQASCAQACSTASAAAMPRLSAAVAPGPLAGTSPLARGGLLALPARRPTPAAPQMPQQQRPGQRGQLQIVAGGGGGKLGQGGSGSGQPVRAG